MHFGRLARLEGFLVVKLKHQRRSVKTQVNGLLFGGIVADFDMFDETMLHMDETIIVVNDLVA